MWQLLVGALMVLLVAAGSAKEVLPLNPSAILINEVTTIHHNETSRHVIINLAEKRTCREPTFMVRLSGMSLYVLDLVKTNDTDKVNFAYPPMHDAGQYFLEVISLYCETLNPNQFAHMCLTNPQEGRNVLTLPNSFEVKEVEHTKHPRPRWVLAHNATPALLPTRYQKTCGNTYTFCDAQESDIAQHNLYHWTDKPQYEHLVKTTLEWGMSDISNTTRTGNESITICMIGASHAGHLFLSGHALNIPHVRFFLYQSRYPQLFNVNDLSECTYAVIGYGQWPLSSWLGNTQFNAERYESAMRGVFEAVKSANTKTQVFMRSMNLNPLGARHASCPAGDYRHPPLVMMYNSILARLCREYSVPFIDMQHLQAPLWDIALDWNHPVGRVFTAEAELIVHSVLTHSHKHKLMPRLIANPELWRMPEYGIRVRFTDSDKIYLFEGGKFRAFLSTQNMVRLGYNDNSINVVDASKKPLELIGPDLPDI